MVVNGQITAIDKEGYLLDLQTWTPTVAEAIADREGVQLTDAHWEIIYLLRHFYQEFEISPAMRPLSNYVKRTLGAEKARSVYLLSLFPGSPPKLGAKIAGLPRPANCI